jgi:hypothetical protein
VRSPDPATILLISLGYRGKTGMDGCPDLTFLHFQRFGFRPSSLGLSALPPLTHSFLENAWNHSTTQHLFIEILTIRPQFDAIP